MSNKDEEMVWIVQVSMPGEPVDIYGVYATASKAVEVSHMLNSTRESDEQEVFLIQCLVEQGESESFVTLDEFVDPSDDSYLGSPYE